MKFLRRVLQHPIPLNGDTAAYALLEGAILSIPAGALLARWRSYNPPELASILTIGSSFAALLLMPIWCALRGKRYPRLRAWGLATATLVFLVGLLFPAT